MFAGKTKINKTIIPHAAQIRVCGKNSNTPKTISTIPDMYTIGKCQGMYGGIIFMYIFGFLK